jgi:hypothetical protein
MSENNIISIENWENAESVWINQTHPNEFSYNYIDFVKNLVLVYTTYVLSYR